MKHFGIYIAVFLIATACANQGQLAQYDDDGIYARPANQQSGTANPSEAYYFLDEQGTAQNGFSDASGTVPSDDYVPEARALPSESGRVYNNQRYNNPTHFANYASAMPLTMRMGYSAFDYPFDPFMTGFGGGNMMFGVGFGYNPWWNPWMFMDPWNPMYRWYRHRHLMSFFGWHSWSPWGPYGHMGFGWGYNLGFNAGYWCGINSYAWNQGVWTGDNWTSNNNSSPRPALGGSSFNAGGSSGLAPGVSAFESRQQESFRRPADGVQNAPSDRGGINRGDQPSRTDNFSREANPGIQRIPSPERNDGFFGGSSRDRNNGSTAPSRGGNNSRFTPPARSNPSPSVRPGSSSPSRNFNTPSRSPSPRTSPSSRPSAPRSPGSFGGGSRSGGSSIGGGGSRSGGSFGGGSRSGGSRR